MVDEAPPEGSPGKKQRAFRTPQQQIADHEAAIARLSKADRRLDTGQKIIVGGLVLALARKEPGVADWLLQQLGKYVTREVDQRRLKPLLPELRKVAGRGTTPP